MSQMEVTAPDLGGPNGELVALPPHVLDEDGDVQGPAPADGEGVGRLARLHPERQVALQFAVQPVLEVPRRHILALLAGKGGGVDQEVHAHRRLLHLATKIACCCPGRDRGTMP